ncbi:MAG: TPM domain-containing protein [Gammaproteobacteria bacterium]
MVNVKRWLVHALMPPWRWRRAFPKKLLKEIETAITQSERRHRGELKFAVENALPPRSVWRGLQSRERALEVFSNLRVWDTEENSGVLIYLLLADREVHLVADRGIAGRVDPAEWNTVAAAMQQAFRQHDFRKGSLTGIERITDILASHFPAAEENPNELSDRPAIITR